MISSALLVHNFYRSSLPSGENVVAEAEAAALRERGIHVSTYFRYSDEVTEQGLMGAIRTAPWVPWNPRAVREIRQVLRSQPVDVVHVHNTFPLISPAVFRGMRGLARRVLTLHNYRLFCAKGIPLRDGNTCTTCIDRRSAWPALRHGCYRGSRLATVAPAASIALHRSLDTWQDDVDAFIVLSEFQREMMVNAGLPEHKLFVKSNSVPDPGLRVPFEERDRSVVYVGRLGQEKGLATLLATWRQWGCDAPELRIIGEGDQRQNLEKLANGLPVKFLGQQPPENVRAELAHARLLVLPSECIETSSLAVLEAFAQGTPGAVSDIGPLPDIVGVAGVTFKTGDPSDQLQNLRQLWADQDRLKRLGELARTRYEEHYSVQANVEQLLGIYEGTDSTSTDHRAQ